MSTLEWSLVGLGIAVVLVIGGGLGYRAVRQRRTARALTIGTPDRIVDGGFVRIGGIDQWIEIRGTDRANPILLMLHGHGLPMGPFAPRFQAWEEHFTLVQWDRRIVGKTLSRNGKAGADAWTFERYAADGIEVVEYLRRRLGERKVVLLAHSQGSVVGTLMAQRRPDLFDAYVGVGQMVDMGRNEAISYEQNLALARSAGNRKAVSGFVRLGPPPYPHAKTWIAKQRLVSAVDPEFAEWQKLFTLVLFAPGYSLRDLYHALTAATFLPEPLYRETMAWVAGTRFEVPVHLLHGAADCWAMPRLAEEFAAQLTAPAKGIALLDGTGHMGLLTAPERYLAELLDRVGSPTGA